MRKNKRCFGGILAIQTYNFIKYEFLNVFHLIFTTKNKYYFPKSYAQNYIQPKVPHICYERYILNVDALDTKAIVLGL